MNLQLFLLLIVVVTALAFDFTNGFHDTGNAMATSIASGALAPRVAVALSAVLNLIGAFLSTAVAATIAKGLIDANLVTLELVFAGLVGGIVWNLLTWLLGIPSSSSHALIGGIVGATIAAVGLRGVIWSGVVSKVIVPAVVAALLATLVGAVGTWLVYRTTRGVAEKRTERGFRRGQIDSASLVSLAHGTNDAQKTMGVIFLALMSYGAVSTTASVPPLWVIVSCAVAMAAGTYLGGWRIIRTLGKGLVEIKPPQGMAAESIGNAIKNLYNAVEPWVQYGFNLTAWAVGWLPYIGILAPQINFFYYLGEPIVQAVLFNAIDFVDGTVTFSQALTNIETATAASINQFINTEINWIRGFLPPLPPISPPGFPSLP